MKTRPRRTKIIATLGPATDTRDMMLSLIQAGVNVVRINCSHGGHKDQKNRIELALSCAEELGKTIGILIDLQGPKIRIARFADPEGIQLPVGAHFILDADYAKEAGNAQMVGLDYPALPTEVRKGDELLLDDGRIIFLVEQIVGTAVHCTVKVGGNLKSNKGLNRKGGGLSAPSLTEKDKEDIAFLATHPVDYVAISFPKSAADIEEARRLVQAAGSHAHIVSKIERAEAVINIQEIIEASDAVMVARGDLGVEVGYTEVPAIQKEIIYRSRLADKAVITATQMMESMITNPIPTRAEVSDVANAILDGTDAVMLSAETATGDFPIQVITSMNEICQASERHKSTLALPQEKVLVERHDKAIAMAAMYIANHVPITAIVALTESGSTPLWMSRVRSGIPIYALSRDPRTRGRMTLCRGVYPVYFDLREYKPWEISRSALDLLIQQGIIEKGDKVIVTKGDILGVGGCTNALKILTA